MAVKEEYRLKTLFKLRELKKEQAERYLATCLQALRVEQDRQREMEEELERMIARREAKKREYAEKAMSGKMDARSAVAANLYIERLREQEQVQEDAIEGQKGVVAEKKQDVQGARADLVNATQELKALEKHREKWQEEVKRVRQSKEEETLDEVAQSGFLGRDRDK
ncbi:MAG: hypothetical protein R3C68_14385 [Myxococcota bacterium]